MDGRKQVCSYRGRSSALPYLKNHTENVSARKSDRKEENKKRRKDRQKEGSTQKMLAQAVMLPTCIQETSGSKLELETVVTGSSWFPQSHQANAEIS
jgi:hypothetical protein